MGKITTLLNIVQKLDKLNKEYTIYAEEPWAENSKAIILQESNNGEIPEEAEKLNLKYFLEVFIAQDFLEAWQKNIKKPLTLQKKCLRLIEYAINDA